MDLPAPAPGRPSFQGAVPCDSHAEDTPGSSKLFAKRLRSRRSMKLELETKYLTSKAREYLRNQDKETMWGVPLGTCPPPGYFEIWAFKNAISSVLGKLLL